MAKAKKSEPKKPAASTTRAKQKPAAAAASPMVDTGLAAQNAAKMLFASRKRDNLSERDLQIAAEVDAVADDLGVPSSQVALAWTRARHRWIHPIIGARTVDQLTDSVAALDLDLPADAVRRLDEASSSQLGFPQDFIAMAREFVYGSTIERFEPRA